MKSIRTLSLLALGFLAVASGLFVRQEFLRRGQTPAGLIITADAAPLPQPAPSPKEIARPHLIWAQREAANALDEHLKEVDQFFADSRQHTPEFAQRALGWGSKWRFAADHVPFTKGGRHQAFIRAQFEEHLFTPTQLAELVEQVVAGYLAHLRSVEGEMLVRVRADVADFPEAYPIARLDEADFEAQYDEAVAQALAAASSGMRFDVGTLLVSEIAGEVLAQVAIRLGVSAGILTAGAGSSWATFGVGLVVGLIVDQIVSWVWDWYADPIGSLTMQLNAKLDGIHRLLVDGSDEVQGLRSRLKAYAEKRARVRESAVLAVLEANERTKNNLHQIGFEKESRQSRSGL
ncbi:MAG TPA: hypothetical protein VJ783_30435 [Pirellulales bacterium]|nr:hypothetical protein [Pirellulales bacterium]